MSANLNLCTPLKSFDLFDFFSPNDTISNPVPCFLTQDTKTNHTLINTTENLILGHLHSFSCVSLVPTLKPEANLAFYIFRICGSLSVHLLPSPLSLACPSSPWWLIWGRGALTIAFVESKILFKRFRNSEYCLNFPHKGWLFGWTNFTKVRFWQ